MTGTKRKIQVLYVTHNDDAWGVNPPEKWPHNGFGPPVPKNCLATEGDLLLIYRFPARTEGAGICEMYRVERLAKGCRWVWVDRFNQPLPEPETVGENSEFVDDMTLVARLNAPISYSEMGRDPAIRRWGRWRARFRGFTNHVGLVPHDVWQALRRLIIESNPEVAPVLKELGA